MRLLLSVDDLTTGEVAAVLARAEELRSGDRRPRGTDPLLIGLLFASASLRTRVGFHAAVASLGGQAVDVGELRWSPEMSAAESFEDTLRTVSGITDLVVARTPFAQTRELLEPNLVGPLINAGDASEHPTQALIDLFGIELERGPIGDLDIGICGDLGMRAVQSLVRLLERFPPRSLALMAPEGRDALSFDLPPELSARCDRRSIADFSDVDVVYLAGLPAQGKAVDLDNDARRAFALTPERCAALRQEAVVVSPLPVIDEIDDSCRSDPRVRLWAPSDASVAVRAAVLELALGRLEG